MAEVLRLKLLAKFPGVPFQVFLSYPVLPIDEDDNYHLRGDCIVRFHSVREGEIGFVVDLEDCHYEACGIIEW